MTGATHLACTVEDHGKGNGHREFAFGLSRRGAFGLVRFVCGHSKPIPRHSPNYYVINIAANRRFSAEIDRYQLCSCEKLWVKDVPHRDQSNWKRNEVPGSPRLMTQAIQERLEPVTASKLERSSNSAV